MAPGWYADPAGTATQRWWDGTNWTEHQHDPALEVYGVTAAQVAGPQTSANTVFIWVVVLLPIVSVITLATFDFNGFLRLTAASAMSPTLQLSPIFSPSYLLLSLLSWGMVAATIVLAYFDWRVLKRRGIARPFHWAWSFLGGGVYVVGRSVVVRRRTGGGMLPMWIYLAIVVVGVVVSIVQIASMLETMMTMLPRLNG